jgi:hypothetical protein
VLARWALKMLTARRLRQGIPRTREERHERRQVG